MMVALLVASALVYVTGAGAYAEARDLKFKDTPEPLTWPIVVVFAGPFLLGRAMVKEVRDRKAQKALPRAHVVT